VQEWLTNTREFINQADISLMAVGLGFALWKGILRLGREYDALSDQLKEAKLQIRGYERVATVTTEMAATALPANGGKHVPE
jgi:hypothetical protein